MEFCKWAINQIERDANPHWMDPSRMQGHEKVMVWCGIWNTRVIGPFFIEVNLNTEKYLNSLTEDVIPSIMTEDGEFPSYFQQDTMGPHHIMVSTFVDGWTNNFRVTGLGAEDQLSGRRGRRISCHLTFTYEDI